ncbi:MAG: tRNA dihydrouridine synthase DusB, partial [Dysgonamonadaceae bacterium]|nr:tRNA dihydrouridine synthase DusB [Dysgonamonadaceae bacterium]
SPWIFREIKEYLATGKLPEKQPFEYYLDILKRQILQSINRLDERRGILHSRRHIAASPLFKGIPDFKPTKVAMLRANTLDELFGLMDGIKLQ